MNKQRFLLAFIVVFVLLELLNYLIFSVILMPSLEAVKDVFRTGEDMLSKMWVMYVTDIIWSFFFVFFFVKGYEKKGIGEGIRFGIYIGLFFSFVSAYSQFVIYPLPYSMILGWFIYGLIEMIILGIVTSLIYKPKEEIPAAASA